MTFSHVIKIICLSLSLFLLGSLSIFASSDTVSPSVSEEAPFTWVDLEQATIMKGAEEIKSVTVSSYTTTDIYNLLYSALRGSSTSSNYSLPYIANNLKNIADVLTGTASGLNPISNISDALLIHAGDTTYSQAELTGMIWSIVQNVESDLQTLYTLSNQNTQLIQESQRTNAKLEYVFSAIEDTINIKWYDAHFVYDNTALSLGGTPLTSQTSSNKFYVTWHATSEYYPNTPCILRLFLPINRHSALLTNSDIFRIEDLYAQTYRATIPDYFTELTPSGFYIYLFDFKPYTSNSFTFVISSDVSITFNPNIAPHSYLIPFDTLDYQVMKTAFYESRSARSLSELDSIASTLSSLLSSAQSSDSAVNALSDYIVSPEKQAAEDASQPVINETLDNFTGSGSSAPKVRDVQDVSSVSSSIREFATDPDATMGDGLSIFSFGNELYNFFSRTTYNNLRTLGTNNRNTKSVGCYGRTSDNDEEVIDFVQQNLDYWEAYKHK